MNSQWNQVRLILNSFDYHKSICVSKSEVPPPTVNNGFEESIGEPENQIRDMRMRINGTECMHVKEYDEYYSVHRDRVDPKYDPLGHLLYDSPEVLAAIAAGILSAYGAGKVYYDKVKDSSEHPILESTGVAILSGIETAISTYQLGKKTREWVEGHNYN